MGSFGKGSRGSKKAAVKATPTPVSAPKEKAEVLPDDTEKRYCFKSKERELVVSLRKRRVIPNNDGTSTIIDAIEAVFERNTWWTNAEERKLMLDTIERRERKRDPIRVWEATIEEEIAS